MMTMQLYTNLSVRLPCKIKLAASLQHQFATGEAEFMVRDVFALHLAVLIVDVAHRRQLFADQEQGPDHGHDLSKLS